MTGRHRSAGRPRATPAKPPARATWAIEMVDARTHAAHLVTDDAIAAGRRAQGRYVTVCGVELLAASLTAPPQGRCRSCASIPTQRSRTSR